MALERGQRLLSLDDYLLLPDDPRGEVFDGVFTVTPTPTPRHQLLGGYIHRKLGNWLEDHPGTGITIAAPMDVVLKAERPAVILQPDVLFISADHTGIVQRRIVGAPDLVVEVVSPSSGGRDAVTKRDLYARHGISEYWLVWPDDERVDALVATDGAFEVVHTLFVGDMLTSALLPGFQLDLAALFAEGRWAP